MESDEEEFDNGECFYYTKLSDVFEKNNILGEVVQDTDDFVFIEEVGRGTYGEVHMVKKIKDNNKISVLKEVYAFNTDSNIVKNLINEIMILKSLSHPNIIKIEGFAQNFADGSIYIEYEYYPYTLQDIISLEKEISEGTIKSYTYQLFDALSYIHSKGIFHRDVTPSNILLSPSDKIILTDFNMSKYIQCGESDDMKCQTPCLTTLQYRAPEVLLDIPDYNESIDIWAVGCIIVEMINEGEPLFNGTSDLEQLKNIFTILGLPNEGNLPGYSDIPFFQYFSVEIQEFKLLKKSLKKINDEIILDLLNKIFTYNYKERLKAIEGKIHPYLSR
uniref:Cyclin-dependent kinase 5 (inferred by orthology to a human protein) n=1 Tax=Strongyloides venezuelensis TaxID=75913 RepID=A0A0K0G2J9_STRVS